MGRGLAGLFSFLGIGTASTGAGLLGMFWSSPAGGREQMHSIAGTDATIQINSDTLQGTVYVNGVETTISVVATTVDVNGNPTGFAPATPTDAENLSTLGVDISDPSGVIDTSPLNSEGVDESESAEGIEHTGKFPPNPSQTAHILDPSKPGHLADTPENRELIEGTITEENYMGPDRWGNDWYGEERPDGTQSWVSVRNGTIQDGGSNAEGEHREYHPETGLSSPTK